MLDGFKADDPETSTFPDLMSDCAISRESDKPRLTISRSSLRRAIKKKSAQPYPANYLLGNHEEGQQEDLTL